MILACLETLHAQSHCQTAKQSRHKCCHAKQCQAMKMPRSTKQPSLEWRSNGGLPTIQTSSPLTETVLRETSDTSAEEALNSADIRQTQYSNSWSHLVPIILFTLLVRSDGSKFLKSVADVFAFTQVGKRPRHPSISLAHFRAA